MRTRIYPIAFLLLVGISLLFVQIATAAFGNIKLNAPLVNNGDVTEMLISPDDQWVVYLADQDTDDVFEVYSTRLDGSVSPIKLSGLLVSNGDVDVYRGLTISPDSAWVVYRADQDTDNVFEIYSVPIDGSNSPTKLNGTLVDGGEVARQADEGFFVSPDSQWVVYVADQDVDNVYELYSVPIDGSSSPVKLNGPLITGGSVVPAAGYTRVSPNSDWLVYRADQDTDNVIEIYSVPIDGSSSPVKLNAPIVAGGTVLRHQLSPDGQWVIYIADQDTDNVRELFSVLIDGSHNPVKLNDPVNNNSIFNLSVSPDSNWVVYVADQDFDAVDEELYSVSIDGSGGPIQLARAPLVYDSSPFGSIVISPDNNWVVYGVDDSDMNRNLYSIPIDGSLSPVKLNSPLAPYQWIYRQKITADSSTVVYSFAAETVDGESIFSVPIDGSESAIQLDSPLINDFVYMGDFSLSEDGNRVIFLSTQDIYNVYELYSVPIDGSHGRVTLNGTLVSGRTVSRYIISTDTQQVVYLADQATDDVFEVYASKLPHFVSIDAIPGRADNSIFCLRPQERIAVALLSNESFDAPAVDHTSVTFAGAWDYQLDPRTGEPVRREQDIDRDGDIDLLFYFLLSDTDLTCESTVGTLQGETFAGQPFVGSDMVKMVTRR